MAFIYNIYARKPLFVICSPAISSLSYLQAAYSLPKLTHLRLRVSISYYTLLFWLYWLIALWLGALLALMLIREGDRGLKATAAMLLAPIILRVLLVK